MKKIIAFVVAVTMIFGFARPVDLMAAGNDNPFNEIFPVDIPMPG